MSPNKPETGILSRLLMVLVGVILIAVLLMLAVFALSSRQTQIDSRVSALKVQAYDIAYLASENSSIRLGGIINLPNVTTRQMLGRKLRQVYEDYAAYCLVVDRAGNMTGYFSDLIRENKELASQLDTGDIARTLARVLMGEEVILQTRGTLGPMFTVAVPWLQNDKVVGAVYIQTSAQTMTDAYSSIWQQAAVAALLTFFVAATIAYFYSRRLVTPIRRMAASAGLIARGLPAPKVEKTDFAELNELGEAFNHMSRQIQDTEETRKAFIANLSHELRSPMTSIQGFVQSVLDGTVKPENQNQTLQIVLDESKRLNKLISALLTLSRAEAPQTKVKHVPFNICELIRLVLITRINQIESKSIRVETDFEQDDMYALGVKEQIEQVLINLMDNAIRYTPANGVITLSVQTQDKKTLAITVKDNGLGIAKEDRDHVFDRFYKAEQSHTAGEGVGLGLAIVKAILEQHEQGIMLLDSDEGAAFRFTLAKADENTGRQHAGEGLR